MIYTPSPITLEISAVDISEIQFFFPEPRTMQSADQSLMNSTAYIRNHKEWYDVSDSKYTRIDPAQVQSVSHFFFVLFSPPNCAHLPYHQARSAYILYYRLR